MPWCCPTFETHFENAGRHGLSVFASKAGEVPRFVLQSRTVDAGREVTLRIAGEHSPISQVAISHCPWCGVDLGAAYRDDAEDLLRPELLIGWKDS